MRVPNRAADAEGSEIAVLHARDSAAEPCLFVPAAALPPYTKQEAGRIAGVEEPGPARW